MNPATVKTASLAFLAAVVASGPAMAVDTFVDEHGPALAIVSRLIDAQTRYDQADLEAVLAPGYFEVSPLGQLDERATVIGFYGRVAAKHAKDAGISQTAELSDINLDIGVDRALVAATETVHVVRAGAKQSLSFRVFFILQRLDSGWQIKASQYTPIRDTAAK